MPALNWTVRPEYRLPRTGNLKTHTLHTTAYPYEPDSWLAHLMEIAAVAVD
ncbi:hypothetical protein ACFYXC_34875 [Streptomyces sp. NPDC002701]|uniref:hypothetical protein n=1 Tax=Streptomyces sp. NPDC002701 TaxID=3364661 RepID=UPI0036908B54